MAWQAEPLYTAGSFLRIRGEEYVVLAGGRSSRIVLKDSRGQLVRPSIEVLQQAEIIVIDEFQDIPPQLRQLLLDQALQIGAVYLKRAAAGRRAARVLDVCAAFIPLRIANEEFGDLLEDFTRRINAGQHRLAYIRLVTGVLYTTVNVIGYFVQNALGRRKAG